MIVAVFHNQPVEILYTPREPLPEHRFSNFVPPRNATEGVKPNLGYVRAPLQNHADFPHALDLLVKKWGDKDVKQDGSSRVDLYSHGKRVAIATPQLEYKPAKLDILVDLDEFGENRDPNVQAFEHLLFVNLALYAGIQEKSQKSLEYEAPAFSTSIAGNSFSQEAIALLSSTWEGLEDVVFTARDASGNIIRKSQGEFDVYGGNDYQFRLEIIAMERILSISGSEIARVVSLYQRQPGNEVMLPNDQSPIPLPVISAPEVVVVGSSEQELYQHLEQVVARLNEHTKTIEKKISEVSDVPIVPSPDEVTIFQMPAVPTSEVSIAAD